MYLSDDDCVPGTVIYHHPEHSYRKRPGVTATQVKTFALQSPAHYHHRYLGEPLNRAESAAMVLGSLVHCLVLEPEQVECRYTTTVEADDQTLCTVADIRQWLKDHNLSAGGNKSELIERAVAHNPDVKILSVLETKQKDGKKKVIKPDVFDQARRMADSVRQHPDAQQLLAEGEPEVSVWGQHDDTGLLTKCRPDWLRDGICADLKTCGCAAPRAFGRSVIDYGYDLQQAHYLNTLNSAGIPVEVFAFIAVESEPPYLTQVYMLDSEDAGTAVQRWHQVMCELYECQQLNRWPGYTDEVELTLPGWYANQYGALA